MIFIDTNVLIDYPTVIEHFYNEGEEEIVILQAVLKELDNLAHGKDRTLAKKVSRTINYLEEHLDEYTIADCENSFADDALLEKASYDTIITNDRLLRIRAFQKDIAAFPYYENVSEYTGITYYNSPEDDKEIAELFSPSFSCPYENHYFVVREKDKENIYLWQSNYLRFIDRDDLQIKDSYSNKVIRPRNIEQIALMDMLKDKKRTIVYVGGRYGSGKSFLTTAYAINQLEAGKIDKIVYVPNNAQGKDTMEIGTLPGDEYMKFVAYMGTLTDIIGDYNVQQYYESGKLEIMPIGLARGRNLENAIVIVNEAQNLTEDHVKLLLGRCAEGTRIFFDGDIKQTDKNIFQEKSGLRLLTALKDSEEYKDLFSMVILQKTERSRTAEAAQYLEEIQEKL